MTEKLLPDIPKNKYVIANDFFGKKHKRPFHKFRFSLRAFGILRKGNTILVERHPLLNKFGLPGGGVDMGENIAKGLYREYQEETGLKIKIKKLLGISEDFFTHNGEDIHGVLVYYEVVKTGGKLLTKGNGKDVAEVKFINLTDIKEKTFQNAFWKFLKNMNWKEVAP